MTGSLFRWRLRSAASPVGRLVSPRAVFFQTLHHDPVQVALELVYQLRFVDGSTFGSRRQLLTLNVANRVLGRTGSFSRMVLRIASMPEAINSFASNGVLPASNS